MLELIKNKIFPGKKKIVGLEVTIQEAGDHIFNLVKLRIENDQVSVIETESNFKSIDLLKNKLGVHIPFVISISGKGLIHKSISYSLNSEYDADKLCSAVMPNASSSDFYLQAQRIDNELVFVSLIRKNTLQPLLSKLNNENLFCTGLVLGPFSAGILTELAAIKSLRLPELTLHIANQRVVKLQKEQHVANEDYVIQGEKLNSHTLIAFTNALQLINTGLLPWFSENSLILKQKSEHLFQKIFKPLAVGGLILIFAMLLINNLVFFRVGKENSELNLRFKQEEQALKTLKSLEEANAYRSKFISQYNLNINSKLSYYADRIASVRPGKIRFTALSIIPMIGEIKPDKEIEYDKGSLLIEGVSGSQELNEFVHKLEEEEWVESVVIQSFSRLSDGTSDFQIKMAIN